MAIIRTPQYVCDIHGESCTGGAVETYRFVTEITEVITTTEQIQTGVKKEIVTVDGVDSVKEVPIHEEKEVTKEVTRTALVEKELCEELRNAHRAATALLGDQDNREIRSLPVEKSAGHVQPTLPGTEGNGTDPLEMKLPAELQEEIRVWGKKQGLEVKDRGALKKEVKRAFFAAHPNRIPSVA